MTENAASVFSGFSTADLDNDLINPTIGQSNQPKSIGNFNFKL